MKLRYIMFGNTHKLFSQAKNKQRKECIKTLKLVNRKKIHSDDQIMEEVDKSYMDLFVEHNLNK